MTPPVDLTAQVSKAIDKHGVEKVAIVLELTEETTFRIAHGNDVRPVSVKHAVAQLKLRAAELR